MLAVLIRTLTYATLFVGFVLVYLPARTLAWAGVVRPSRLGVLQVLGGVLSISGAMLALWCIASFIVIGRGTPAPFDPPRRLVVRGPYRYLRNPMYLGAGLALGGAALFYQSAALLAYAVGFLLVTHVFVVMYEESILQQTFGEDYTAYRRRVHRWLPTL